MEEELNFNLPIQLSSIIKVIGVGGGGGNAVNYMHNQGIVGVDFIVCNTDNQALELSKVPNKIQLGQTGLGAGSRPEIAEQAAHENADVIMKSIIPNTQMLFVVAGMGGGTGTGAAPIIAGIARQHGILTVGIVTMPFDFEGKRRQQLAIDGIAKLRPNVDSLIVINNNKLREMYGNKGFRVAISNVDQVMSIAAKRIAEIITCPGYINLDFEDVKYVLQNSRTAIMGHGIACGENRAEKLVKQAVESPLLNDNQIIGAQKILLHITSGTEELTEDEIEEICSNVHAEAGPEVDIFLGYTCDETLGENVSLTIIATGVAAKSLPPIIPFKEPDEVAPQPIEPPIDEKPSKEIKPVDNECNGGQIIPLYPEKTQQNIVQEVKPQDNGIAYVVKTNETGAASEDANAEIEKEKAEVIAEKRESMVESLRGLSMFKPEDTDKLSEEPAYLRKKLELEEARPSSENEDSVVLSLNNELLVLGNTFMTPNVD